MASDPRDSRWYYKGEVVRTDHGTIVVPEAGTYMVDTRHNYLALIPVPVP